MKKIIAYTVSIVLIFWISTYSSTQWAQKTDSKSVDFSKLITIFEQNRHYGLDPTPDTIELPLVHSNNKYIIELSDNPVAFDRQTVILKNPFDDKFPVSFSVIYQDRLISLFEQGIFVCHSIPSMSRDTAFEKKISTRKFKYHWLIDDKLVGFSGSRYYSFDSESGWSHYDLPLPIKNQPVLFDDESYVCFRDCHGEWGGTIYFFDKNTHKTHYTSAICANSVLKNHNNYFVLSHLGHAMGYTERKKIVNPSELPVVEAKYINKTVGGQALGYTDVSKASCMIFNYFGIQLFSSFIYNDITLYMVNWRKATFLAEIENSRISIINPLFSSDLYTHDPITRSYGNTILINLDFYGIGYEREVSGIIIRDKTLIKYDWNK